MIDASRTGSIRVTPTYLPTYLLTRLPTYSLTSLLTLTYLLTPFSNSDITYPTLTL
jgi:hypothetical protein